MHTTILKPVKEYWVNVYEYDIVKNTQFYSHNLLNRNEAKRRANLRRVARPDSKCVYRIHIKLKPGKLALPVA